MIISPKYFVRGVDRKQGCTDFFPSGTTQAVIVFIGIALSNHNKFMMSWRSRGPSRLAAIQSFASSCSDNGTYRNIDRHDDGRWYKRVSVFWDCERKNGNRA